MIKKMMGTVRLMADDEETTREAQALRERFAAVANKAAFAREHGVPGKGAAKGVVIDQHIKGVRPISLEAAMAYARGFGVPLEEISQRLAILVSNAAQLLGERARPSDFSPEATELATQFDEIEDRKARIKAFAHCMTAIVAATPGGQRPSIEGAPSDQPTAQQGQASQSKPA